MSCYLKVTILRSILVTAVGVSLIAGCAQQPPSIIGDWTYEKMPAGITSVLTFKPDGSWSQTLNDGKSDLSVSGTYLFEEKKLTMKQRTDLKVGGRFNQTFTHTIKWISNDKFEYTDTKPPTVYVRKK